MAKESRHRIEQQDILWAEYFLDEASVRRNGGNPTAGTIPVKFFNGVAIFDNSAIGFDNEITYPRDTFRLCEPERAFSIRTRVYLTDTDGSVFMQLYDSGAPLYQEFRFLICGIWPAGNDDMLAFELWDDHGATSGVREMRGRKYNTSLVATALNTWKEFVATYDGRGGAAAADGICLYMDGIRVDDAAVILDNGGDYQAMEYNPEIAYQVGRNVEGKMDFIEVWNRVLTPNEIANMCSV